MYKPDMKTLRDTDSSGKSSIVAADRKISSASVFADMLWDRSEVAETRTTIKGTKINWEYLYRSYSSAYYPLIMSFKEFAYACMFDPIEDDTARDTKTVQEYIHLLKSFVDYLQAKSLYCVQDLTHSDLQDYARWLVHQRKAVNESKGKEEVVSLEWADVRVRALQVYFRYSRRVSLPLPVFPLHGENLFKYLGAKRRSTAENRTPTIPKHVWEPFLNGALDYVLIYAEDILRVQAVIEECRNNVLPTHSKKQNFNSSNFRRDVVAPLLNKIEGFVNNPKTGKPWREQWNSLEEVRVELYALYDACIVVIASISGVRESELAGLQLDGIEAETASDGIGKRYRIISQVVKGNRNDRLSWEVNEPVYIACQVMRKITSYARKVSPHPELILTNWYRSPGDTYRTDVRRDAIGRTTKGSIVPIGPDTMTRSLNCFAERLSKTFDGQYRLPDVDGKPWNFTMRQPRRTLAARIAREPFGTIAGMLHYKHVKLTTFLGYAGSDPSWMKDLHDEEIGANEEFLQQVWDDLQDGSLAGPKGTDLIREFKGMAGDMKKNPLQYFIESHRANLHVGLFNYCFFQKDRALCLNESKRQSKDAAPILNACHPDRCANSCISQQHLSTWQVQVDDARAMLAHEKVSDPQRISLTSDLERALRVVNQLNAGMI